jgi:hypothetical protein
MPSHLHARVVYTLSQVHKFLWDRFRGIRQDLTQQHMSNTFSARLHEEMVRFHIMAEHILCEEVATIQDPDGFNSHLNVEQLNKCLTTLFDIYDAYAEKDRALPNEPEMRAYMLLLQLDTHGKFDHNHSQVCNPLRCIHGFRSAAPLRQHSTTRVYPKIRT